LEKIPASAPPDPKIRRSTLEQRLFVWFLAAALVPTLIALAIALGLGARSLQWFGTLGPWAQVAESGRELLDVAGPLAEQDSAVGTAMERHREQLSESLVQATRWEFIVRRAAAVAPVALLAIALLLAALSLAVSRRVARGLARPIHELVGWSSLMAEGSPLPPESAADRSDVAEVRALRAAMRSASERIAESRRRELEAERQRAWGEMARRVAHEMKNPLTPLRLAVHRLERGRAADIGEAVTVIREETERLDELARQFAALGRPPEGPPSEVDVGEMLEELAATDVPPSVRVTVTVLPGTSTVRGHHDALLRAFRNLVRNAVEALASRGGTGAIELRVSPTPDAGVEVRVVDNGAGLPAGEGERIFEPDFSRKPGGTGLGLAIVRQTVAAHGGRIDARTRAEGGAEFIIRLPSAPPGAEV
jgi:nitrogen fixation/metabolism regulation signal transduction histidine kinase